MQSKLCKTCSQNFVVTDDDLNFYKKISPTFNNKFYQIPSPNICPHCRTIRRLTYRNENKLYRRKSDLTGIDMISVFRPNSPYKIYTKDEWWSDKWDPMDYGQNPDPNKSFFDQFHELLLKVPRPPLINNKAENSEYCNFADGNKNSYMITSANRNQDCYYGFLMVENRDCMDCLWCTKCELLYECIDCQNCYNLSYSQLCENCVDSSFLYNCKSLNNCLFCVNLKNTRFNIANKQVTKEEYEKVLAELRDPKFAIEKFEQIKLKFPIRKANNFISCENVTGENIFHSKNIRQGFDVYSSRDSAYLHDGLKATDCHDICFFDGTELCYESTSLIGYGYRFTNFCRDSYNLFYCDNCHSCKNLFACAGLRKKEYCIFNKQYSKEDYERTAAGIVEQMMKAPREPSQPLHAQSSVPPIDPVESHSSQTQDATPPAPSHAQAGEWGEFFPAEKSLFPFEDTLAKEYSTTNPLKR